MATARIAHLLPSTQLFPIETISLDNEPEVDYTPIMGDRVEPESLYGRSSISCLYGGLKHDQH